jgi:hypothetical protein
VWQVQLWQIVFTKRQQRQHPNISPGSMRAFDAEINEDVAWSFTEKGYRSHEDAQHRAGPLIKHGEFAMRISSYEQDKSKKFIIRNRQQEIDSNCGHHYLMATKAYHLMGDISRSKPEPCSIYAEDEELYYGMWVLGMGFIGVQFPKDTTRPPTPEEKAHWEKMKIGMFGSESGNFSYGLPSVKFE